MLTKQQTRTSLLLLSVVCFALVAADAKRHSVSIKEMKFSPASLTVSVGDSVAWANNDDRDHSIAADDGSFKSENLRAGGTFSHQFKKAGKYSYSCTYHPREKGTISVSE